MAFKNMITLLTLITGAFAMEEGGSADLQHASTVRRLSSHNESTEDLEALVSRLVDQKLREHLPVLTELAALMPSLRKLAAEERTVSWMASQATTPTAYHVSLLDGKNVDIICTPDFLPTLIEKELGIPVAHQILTDPSSEGAGAGGGMEVDDAAASYALTSQQLQALSSNSGTGPVELSLMKMDATTIQAQFIERLKALTEYSPLPVIDISDNRMGIYSLGQIDLDPPQTERFGLSLKPSDKWQLRYALLDMANDPTLLTILDVKVPKGGDFFDEDPCLNDSGPISTIKELKYRITPETSIVSILEGGGVYMPQVILLEGAQYLSGYEDTSRIDAKQLSRVWAICPRSDTNTTNPEYERFQAAVNGMHERFHADSGESSLI